MKNLQFKIDINAPKEKVWNIMLNKDTYPEWIRISWPNSYYKGDWAEDNTVKFISRDGSGTLGLVVEHKPYQMSKVKHIAVLLPGGIEDKESEDAMGWIGTTECYTFYEAGNSTQLVVDIETLPSWIKMFEEGWPTALAKLKELSEQ
jgi:hypothetical protein